MAVISVNLTDTFEQWRTKTNSLSTQQGDLTTLTTTAKNTVVAAINELDGAASFSNVVEDTSPQLGGNLDVLARSITTSTTNGNIAITPHGSGKVILDGISHPNADGTNGQVLQTNGSGVLSFATIASDVVDDTSPQLGGNLDVLARTIFTSTTNGNIAITPDGSGSVVLDGISHPQADGTTGQVLKTNGSGTLSFAPVITETSATPTAGQTTFTVSYVVGRIAVFLNGIKLLGGGVDFTASNGTSVVLTSGAATSDKIQFQVFA